MDLRAISKELETASHRDNSVEDMNNLRKLSWEQEAKRFEQLATQWNEIVEGVRCLNGFEDFLRPQRLSKLQAAAKNGPVVYLVANKDTSNCLIMTSTLVHHILLPNLKNPVLLALVKIVQAAVSENQISRSSIDEERGTMPARLQPSIQGLSSDFHFRGVLRFLWEEAVKPIVGFLELRVSLKLHLLISLLIE
jgi:hypothetical protein